MEAARAAEAAAQDEVPSPPEPDAADRNAPAEPTLAGGNTLPEPAAEDRNAAPEPAEEQEEPSASAQQPKGSEKTKVQLFCSYSFTYCLLFNRVFD
jgi:hypothetical protein